MKIEVEIKKRQSLGALDICEFCDGAATIRLTVGELRNFYGTDHDVCVSADCHQQAIEQEIEDLVYTRTHRFELMQQERFHVREGK